MPRVLHEIVKNWLIHTGFGRFIKYLFSIQGKLVLPLKENKQKKANFLEISLD